jgi:O-antigen/teichoic acid export membrane protein
MICVERMASVEYATYSLLLIPVMVVSSFTGGLAGQPMMRFATELTPEALSIGLFRVPFLSAIMASLILVVYMITMGQSLAFIALVVCLVLLVSILGVRRNYYVALSRPFDLFVLDATRAVIGLVILYVFMNYGFTGSYIPLIALLGGNFISLLLVSLKSNQPHNHGKSTINGAYLRYGFWVAAWMVMIGLFPLLERVFLKQYEGLSVTGVYAAIADPLVAAMSAFGAILVSVLMPRYVASWSAENYTEIRRLTRIGVSATVAFSCFCLLVCVLLMNIGSGYFVALLKQNQLLALMVIVSLGLQTIGTFFHKPLELKNDTYKMFLYLLCSLIVFVIVALLLVPRFGTIGVASSKIIASCTYVILLKRRL